MDESNWPNDDASSQSHRDEDSEQIHDETHHRNGSFENNDLSFEQRKNDYLHYLLATLRTSELDGSHSEDEGSATQSTTGQLERTYRKALSDYRQTCGQFEAQTAAKGKSAAGLRSCLNEKEDKAEKLTSTLQKYREDISKQSTFTNNGKPLSMEMLEELERQDLGEELERERLRHITNKVNVSQLEQRLRKKNELAGGVSDIEFANLEEDIKKSEKNIKCYHAELVNMNKNGEKLLQLESFLTTAIQNYSEKNQSKVTELRELNEEIESKRAYLGNLNSKSRAAKREIGYDASDIGAVLQTKMVNDDFSSAKDELEKLHVKLNDLVLQHKILVG